MLFVAMSNSGSPFYLGCRNNQGVPSNFCASVFTDIEFFNGTTTKTFNDANDWNGAINYGGVRVVSTDNGATWEAAPKQEYCIKIECSKGDPMVMKFVNFNGMLDTFPINGSGRETITTTKN